MLTISIYLIITAHTKYYGRIKVITQKARTGPRGSGSVKVPDFLDVRHYKGGRLSPIRTGCLYPKRNLWYSFPS
jgi:hypothetical protein